MYNVITIVFISSLFVSYAPRRVLTHQCPKQDLCKCKFHGKLVDLDCVGTKDLLELKQCLKDHFYNFTIRNLFLKQCNATSIPPGIVQNITVRMLYFVCPVTNVSVDAFVGISPLLLIRLYNHKLTVIPDCFAPTTVLQRLWIFNGTLKSVGEQLRKLKNLRIVSLSRNRIDYVSPNAFIDCVNLLEVYLIDNFIKHISPSAFAPCRGIIRLILSNNLLESAKGLIDTLNPRIIELENNNLTDIDIFHPSMWRTTEIHLSDNPVGRIGSSVFLSRYFVNLLHLEMANMSLTEVAEDAFSFLSPLTNLDLSLNKLKVIYKGTFRNLTNLSNLDLSDNKLQSIKGIFGDRELFEMSNFSISGNQIVDLEDSLYIMPNIRKLVLDDNQIGEFNDDNFRRSNSLKVLRARSNNISTLTKYCFAWCVNIEEIDLTSNRLVTLNGSIQNLPNLKKLIVPYNSIEKFEDDDLADLPQLVDLNFQNNLLTSISERFKFLRNLEFLDLKSNRIATLSRNMFPNVIPLHVVLIEGNPLACDCRLEWFREWWKGCKPCHGDDPICDTPDWLNGKSFKNISKSDLVFWKRHCSSPCMCTCIPNGLEFGIKVDCSHNDLTDIPEIFPDRTIGLDVSYNNLTTFPTSNSTWLHYLEELDAENNQLVTMRDVPFSKQYFSIIKLANNKLDRIPFEDWKDYKWVNVTLSDNPYLCDCSTVGFREWLLSFSGEISDINETRCESGNIKGQMKRTPIVYLTESQICPQKLALYIILTIAILGFLFVIASFAVTYYRYRLPIKIWLYSHGFTWVKEDDIDKDKEFDAFISYSNNDAEFVHKFLRPNLENGSPCFYICIHERNFPAGNAIPESIDAAVKYSRRTILVLSKNFLESEWCILEFRTAHVQALKDKINRVIVIIYGELPPMEDIEEELQAYLKSTTYLRWGEKYFWQKLHYALPKVKKERPTLNLQYDESTHLLIGY